jgi:hypothetical protein
VPQQHPRNVHHNPPATILERALLCREALSARVELLCQDPHGLRTDTMDLEQVGRGERSELIESSDAVYGELAPRDLA